MGTTTCCFRMVPLRPVAARDRGRVCQRRSPYPAWPSHLAGLGRDAARLDCAGQPVREQSGELGRILGYVAFGEKRRAVEQFGGLPQ